jgi:hypothetical protein
MDLLTSTLLAKVIVVVAAAIVTFIVANRYGHSFRSPFCFLSVLAVLFFGAWALVIAAEHTTQIYPLLLCFGAWMGLKSALLKTI